MKRPSRALASLFATAVMVVSASANEPQTQLGTGDAPAWSRKTCGRICTVTDSPGGFIVSFLKAAQRIKRDDITLRIDGTCASACTIAADKARPNVCLTPRALLRFHNGYGHDASGNVTRFDPTALYSGDLAVWVDRNGGFPGVDAKDDELLDMDAPTGLTYFKGCP